MKKKDGSELTAKELAEVFYGNPGNSVESVFDGLITYLEDNLSTDRSEPISVDIERGGHALNEAGWAFVQAWKDMGIGPMSGEVWNNCKQGIVYPVVKAYLDNLPRPTPPKGMRMRTREEKIEQLISGVVLTGPMKMVDYSSLRDETIDDLCRAANISLEVEE